LETIEIIRNAALQIVLRRIAELGAGARDVINVGGRIRHAEEVEPRPDLDVSIGQMLADHARDVDERDADASADIVDAALRGFRRASEINAVRRILVVDEVVLLVAALREAEG